MLKFRIDDTGDDGIFESGKELAKFLGCARSNINWHIEHNSDSKNHFWCLGYGITILEYKRPNFDHTEKGKAYRKAYYLEHREKALAYQKQWRKNNKDKVAVTKEKWRKEHQEWFNEYYRTYRKTKRMNNAK